MKYFYKYLLASGTTLLAIGCSLSDDSHAGVTSAGNSGTIAGLVYAEDSAASLSKRIAVASSPSPAAGLMVKLYRDTSTAAIDSMPTDSLGAFLFDSLAAGGYSVQVFDGSIVVAQRTNLQLFEGNWHLDLAMYAGDSAETSEPWYESIFPINYELAGEEAVTARTASSFRITSNTSNSPWTLTEDSYSCSENIVVNDSTTQELFWKKTGDWLYTWKTRSCDMAVWVSRGADSLEGEFALFGTSPRSDIDPTLCDTGMGGIVEHLWNKENPRLMLQKQGTNMVVTEFILNLCLVDAMLADGQEQIEASMGGSVQKVTCQKMQIDAGAKGIGYMEINSMQLLSSEKTEIMTLMMGDSSCTDTTISKADMACSAESSCMSRYRNWLGL